MFTGAHLAPAGLLVAGFELQPGADALTLDEYDRLCSQCGLDSNLIAHRPQVDDVCDVCGGHLAVRDDDNPDALAIRLAEYHAQTKPLIELFQRKEFVATIDATAPVREVQAMIRRHFDLPPHE